MKSSTFRTVIFLIAYFGMLIIFVYYLLVNIDKYLNLLQASLTSVFFILVISFIFPFLNGITNVYLFHSLGAKLSHRDGFLLAAASTLANQLPVSGGVISKGFYLKRKFMLSYAKFFSATLALFICFISVNGFIGMIILLYWILFKKATGLIFLLFGFVLMSSCLLIFWLPANRIKTPYWMQNWSSQLIEGWLLVSNKPGLLMKLISLQTIMMLLLALRYWIAFRMLSQNVTFSQAILFSSASVLTQLVSIAPGGIGINEAIVSVVASMLGFNMGVSILAVMLDRLISTFTIVLLGGVSALILGRQISKR